MKKALLLPVLFFSFLLNAFSADNLLLLTNTRSHETNVFGKGSYLVFELKADGSMHEGFIRDITDSSLVFDNSQVSLSQINIVAGRTRSKIAAGRVANAVGNTLIGTGSVVFDCGTGIIFNSDYYYWPIGGTVWLAGACIAGLGYAFDWALSSPASSMRVRNYRDWNARIMVEGQVQVPEKKSLQPKDSIQTVTPPEKPKKEKKGKVSGDDVYGG